MSALVTTSAGCTGVGPGGGVGPGHAGRLSGPVSVAVGAGGTLST